MTRVVVTSRSFSKHPVLRAELLARYDDVTFNDNGLELRGAALIDYMAGHEKAITALEPLDAALFAALPDLKVIGKYGVGLDMIDLDAMAKHGVKLGWTGGVNKRSVSELVIAFAIALLRHVPKAHAEVRSGTFRQLKGTLLSERTFGILGCGHVGKDLAVLLRAFGCQVLTHDLKDFPDFYNAHGITPVDLATLLSASDILSIHLPLDASTRRLLDATRLAAMKDQAILINTSRGGIVDEATLKSMLIDARLAAAAFDVFAVEPPEDTELLNLENFLATPHIGGSAEEAIIAMGRAAIDGLDNFGDPHGVAAG
jgi:phosphoglycerate dehydrogenase-like enzyme